jgi:hypothetical protein
MSNNHAIWINVILLVVGNEKKKKKREQAFILLTSFLIFFNALIGLVAEINTILSFVVLNQQWKKECEMICVLKTGDKIPVKATSTAVADSEFSEVIRKSASKRI